MNNQFIKKWGGYVVAVVLFVALSVAFFYPIVLEDKNLVQYDVRSSFGLGQDAREYHKCTGDYIHCVASTTAPWRPVSSTTTTMPSRCGPGCRESGTGRT